MFSADEAMIGLPRLAHHHGRMAIIVERANALVIDASLREGDISTDYVNNIQFTLDVLDEV